MQENIITDIGDALGVGAQRRQQEFNAAQAYTQRSWEEYMSNTAYQRAVVDMQKAGLNPALAYGQGGASTPVTNSASSGIQNNNVMAGAAMMVNSAANLVKAIAKIKGK